MGVRARTGDAIGLGGTGEEVGFGTTTDVGVACAGNVGVGSANVMVGVGDEIGRDTTVGEGIGVAVGSTGMFVGVMLGAMVSVGGLALRTVTTIGISYRTSTLSVHNRLKLVSETSAPVHPLHKGINTFCPPP